MIKHFLIFICTLFFVVHVFAQKSLEFSQVKLVSTEETVPDDHVWKVVGVAGDRVVLHQSYTHSWAPPPPIEPVRNIIIINGNDVDVGKTSVGGGAGYGASSVAYNTIYSSSPTSLPLWLPEQTSLEAGDNVHYVSVIEFKVNE